MKTKQNRLLFVLLCIVILFATITCKAQSDYEKSNNLSIISSAGTYIDFGHENFTNHGFNIGLRYAYRNPIVYVGGELFLFPDLNNYDYTHLIGRAGLNLSLIKTRLDDPILRIHAGVRAGLILRKIPFKDIVSTKAYQLLGIEIGLTFDIPDTSIFVSLDYSYDSKTDSKGFQGEPDNHQVNSVNGGVGFRF